MVPEGACLLSKDLYDVCIYVNPSPVTVTACESERDD